MRLFILVILVIASAFYSYAQQRYLVRDVRIIDVENGKLLSPTSVFIADGVIKKIGKNVTVPSSATTIDGSRMYLMPGLWDMHVHATDTLESYFNWPLFIANGVTGIRDMGGNGIGALNRSKALIASNGLIAPRIYGAGNLLDGKPIVHTDQLPIEIGTEVDVRRFVDSMIAGGADFIKAYEMLSRTNFMTLLTYAKQKGKRVVGHVPMTVSVEEAAIMGMHSMEHLRGFDYSFSAKRDSIVQAQIYRIDTATGNGRSLRGRMIQSRTQVASQNFDSSSAVRLLQLLSTKNIYQTPTLSVGNSFWFALRMDTLSSFKEQRRYMPARRLQLWDSLYRIQPASALDRMVVANQFRTVKMMAEQNVPLLTGTDVHNPYLIPGYSLQQELVLMQRAGVPASTILKAATLNAAACLGLQEQTGSVALNKWADLLLLSANPLEQIANTQKIAGVFLKGQYYSRDELQKMLQNVEAQHNRQNR